MEHCWINSKCALADSKGSVQHECAVAPHDMCECNSTFWKADGPLEIRSMHHHWLEVPCKPPITVGATQNACLTIAKQSPTRVCWVGVPPKGCKLHVDATVKHLLPIQYQLDAGCGPVEPCPVHQGSLEAVHDAWITVGATYNACLAVAKQSPARMCGVGVLPKCCKFHANVMCGCNS